MSDCHGCGACSYCVEYQQGVDTSGCNPHPDAPHGFDRNASHDEDRYVCDCEHWVPPSGLCYCGHHDADHTAWAGPSKARACTGRDGLEICGCNDFEEDSMSSPASKSDQNPIVRSYEVSNIKVGGTWGTIDPKDWKIVIGTTGDDFSKPVAATVHNTRDATVGWIDNIQKALREDEITAREALLDTLHILRKIVRSM